MTTTLRIDDTLKRQCDEVLEELGLTMTNALTVFLKQVVRGALKDIAYRLKIFKLYALGLVIDYLIEILIAQSKLNIKPIFRFSLLFQYFKYT